MELLICVGNCSSFSKHSFDQRRKRFLKLCSSYTLMSSNQSLMTYSMLAYLKVTQSADALQSNTLTKTCIVWQVSRHVSVTSLAITSREVSDCSLKCGYSFQPSWTVHALWPYATCVKSGVSETMSCAVVWLNCLICDVRSYVEKATIWSYWIIHLKKRTEGLANALHIST